MKLIDNMLMDSVTGKARESSRMRMNLNFHGSLEDKCHRLLNAMEPGTEIPVHRHKTKDEGIILLRGCIRVNIYNDRGEVTESVVLSHKDGCVGVDIPMMEWHGVECLESGSVIYEVKEGPFMPHDADDILKV